MSFFMLPRELRDQVYKELLVDDDPLDITLLLKARGACDEVSFRSAQNSRN